MRKVARKLGFVATVGTLVVFGGIPANAIVVTPLYGVFSDPITSGNILNDPTVGQQSFLNNSATAYDPITNSGSTLTWGTNSASSTLTFTGNTIPTNPNTPFKLGTLDFTNGTSALNTMIFGATLTFYKGSIASQNIVAADNVIINTTLNQNSGTGLSPSQLQQDADYINICGNSSNICGKSIEAYETSEGGTTLIVDLLGTIIGDPQLTVTDVVLDPSSLTSGGIIGSEQPLAQTPLPATLPLFASGLSALGLLGWRRKRKALAA